MTQNNNSTIDTNATSASVIVAYNDGNKERKITAKNLTVALPNGKVQLVKDLNWVISKGDRIALTGKSGSGKTTLLKAVLGNWDHGSGTVGLPDGVNLVYIPQNVSFSNTNLMGIFNNRPADQYTFTERQVRDALLKVGLPQLVQHLSGQQVELTMDTLLAETANILQSCKDAPLEGQKLADVKNAIIQKARELTAKDFEVIQQVPQKQRNYLIERMDAVFADTMKTNAPHVKVTTEIANAVSDAMDETLGNLVVGGMDKAVRLTAAFRTQGKFFLPRLPLTPLKANYYAWNLDRSLNSQIKRYMSNIDTEDTSRETRINKLQSQTIADGLSGTFRSEVMAKHARKGILSQIFNAITWPLDLIMVPLRARGAAKEIATALAFYMDYQVESGKGRMLSQRLSGGQKKMVMIARARLNKPDILVMDEPTTGLDPESKMALYKEMLAMMPEGSTVISILHDPELIPLHTKHAVLANQTVTVTPVGPK